MSTIRLTKNSLRDQQKKLAQLEKYLPTLLLKKGLLQIEVQSTKTEIGHFLKDLEKAKAKVKEFSGFFSDTVDYDIQQLLSIKHVDKYYENIAGVEIPVFQKVEFQPENFFLFDTPPWLDSVLDLTKNAIEMREQIEVLEEKKRSLEKELRDVSIRVNLFEKVLIPRCREAVKKIKVFLGDQELAAVAQAKVAKQKIEEKRVKNDHTYA